MQDLKKEYWQNYVGGEWVDGAAGDRIEVINPATEERLAEVARATDAEVDRAVAAARACVDSRVLVDMRPLDRGRKVIDMGRLLRERKEEIARLIALDEGKSYSQGLGEVEGSARYFEYYGGLAAGIEGKYIPLGDGYVDYVVPYPYGVSAQIVPWNYPNQMVARSLAPALAAGNAAVVKAPSVAPLAAYVFGELAEEVDLPAGAVNIICGHGQDAGNALIHHPGVDQIVFTGSVATGQKIMHAATERVIPCVLELGGKSAGIVFPDADLDAVETSVLWGIYENSGQVCNAMSRLIVHASIYDEVIGRLVSFTEGLSIGPGMDDCDITPLVTARQLERVADYCQIGIEEGARVATGGRRLDRTGFYMAPTIFADVTPEMRINQEEIFGPVLVVLRFEKAEEAIAIANGTEFGLAAGVFTADVDRALWITERLEAGQIHVNEWYAGGIETPFGGFKKSGIGREKGIESLSNYYQSKNVAFRRLRSTV